VFGAATRWLGVNGRRGRKGDESGKEDEGFHCEDVGLEKNKGTEVKNLTSVL
jgi:hypothetical protein